MFLTLPRHEILAHEGVRIPYAAKLFYDVCAYRDRTNQKPHFLVNRALCEVAFLGTGILALVESAVRLPIAFLGAFFSNHQEDWLRGIHISVLTTFYSLAAVVSNLFVNHLTKTLTYLDISARGHFSDYLLFQACETGQKSVIKKLLKMGADSHLVDPSVEVSSALIPTLTGREDLVPFFELNHFEKGYLDLKKLSHWLSVKGSIHLDGQHLTMEGAPSQWLFESLAESFQRFRTCSEFGLLTLNQKKAAQIEDALYLAYTDHSYDNIALRARQKKLTFIDSGWQNHSICISFYGNYMAVANRGDNVEGNSTLEVYKIDPKKVTGKVVEEILMHRLLSSSKGKKYFYQKLPEKLSPTGKVVQDKLCKNFRSIAPSLQKHGICALASKKGALRFAFAMLLENPPSKETLQRAQIESKLYTDWAAYMYADEKNYHEKYPGTETFLSKVYDKARVKHNRFKATRWHLRLPRFLSRRLS